MPQLFCDVWREGCQQLHHCFQCLAVGRATCNFTVLLLDQDIIIFHHRCQCGVETETAQVLSYTLNRLVAQTLDDLTLLCFGCDWALSRGIIDQAPEAGQESTDAFSVLAWE